MIALACPAPCVAGPPYVTDDPEPAALHETELYLFSAGEFQRGSLGETRSGREANYGVIADLQLSAAISFSHGSSQPVRWNGIGLGVKYRFAHETPGWMPEVSVYPAVEILADGTMELLLPFWIQKDFGAWSVFGGGGFQTNRERGSRDSWLGGAALSRTLGDELSAGAEIYGETADSAGESGLVGLRLAATRRFGEHLSLLGSVGPEFEGRQTDLAYYVALGWRQ